MTRRLFLSHPLSGDTPTYGSNPRFESRRHRDMDRGDTCNTAIFHFHNHSGTHLDAPLHFDPVGRDVSALEPDELVFEQVVLLEIPAGPSELIGPERLEHAVARIANADLVLLRTEFERRRGEPEYVRENPRLAPALADWLREVAPGVRAVGVDAISISAVDHREVGREAHRRFLAPGAGRPILLIEDMALALAPKHIARVWILPLRVLNADGGPCTVVAEIAPGGDEG